MILLINVLGGILIGVFKHGLPAGRVRTVCAADHR